MKIEISKGKAEFLCEAKDIQNALSKINNLNQTFKIKENERVYLFVCYAGTLSILCYTPQTLCSINIKCDMVTKNNTSFGFDASTVSGVIKSRKKIRLKYENNSLNITETTSKLRIVLGTKEVFESQSLMVNKRLEKGDDSVVIDKITSEKIREAVKICTLADIHKTGEDPLVYVSLVKGLVVSSFDNSHCSYYRTKSKSYGIRFPLRSKIFDIIDSLTEEECRYYISENQFKVKGEDFTLSIPPTQISSFDFSKVQTYIKSLSNPVGKVVLPKDIGRTLGNLKTISEEDSQIQFRVNKGYIDLAMGTKSGSLEDKFKTQTRFKSYPFDMNIDPRVFNDLYSKIKDTEPTMEIYSIKSDSVLSCFTLCDKTEDHVLYLIGSYHAR